MSNIFVNCTTVVVEGTEEVTTACYDTKIDATQILSGMVVNLIIGLLCMLGFIVWRGSFRVYFNRLYLPQVPDAQRPPPLDVSGHRRLWSWLVPVFTVSDGALLESAGLDALMAQRVLGFGCMAFVPMTILGIGVLLPVNYTAYDDSSDTDGSTSINDTFLKMTMSSVPNKSSLLWIHFSFTFFFIGWVCILLLHYYREFIALRQAYDERLVQSAELDRRCSLLDEPVQPDSARQIVSTLRSRLSMQSGSWAGGSGDGSGGGAGKRSAVHFASYGGADTEGGTAAAATGKPSGEMQEVLSGTASCSVASEPGATSGPQAVLPAGSHSSTGRPPRPKQLGASGSNGSADTDQPLRARFSHTGASSEDGQPEKGDVRGSGHMFDIQQQAAAIDQQQQRQQPVLAPSPFDSGVSMAGVGERGGGSSLAASGGGARAESGGTPQPAALVLDMSGQASGQASVGCGLQWGELAKPFPILLNADAAQFYAVLVVDEAVEEFKARHEGEPWIRGLPAKFRRAPRRSKEKLSAAYQESKALARLNSSKHKEHVEQCERRMQVAERTYAEIFGPEFDRIVPVYDSRATDKLLSKWHVKRARLDRLLLQQQDAEEKLRKLEQEEAQEEAAAGTGGSGPIGSGATGSGSSGAIGSEGTGNGAVTNRAISNVRTVSGSGGAMGSSSGAIRSSASGALASGSGAFDSGAIAGSGSREDAADAEAAPARRAWACCGGGDAAAARRKQMAKLSARLTKLADEVLGAETALADLQGQIEEEQEVAAEALPAPCFFATFHSAQAAAYAARLNLNPMHERMMRALPAPAPNNVNYSALMRGWMARGTRPLVVSIFVAIMILFPIGVFAGLCGTIVSSICGGAPGSTLSARQTWFCASDDKLAEFLRTMISSVLPSILLSVWQAIVLPQWFYNCAQAEGSHHSFTTLDLRCAYWFFLHDVLNVFIGGMLGGSIMASIRRIIDDPKQFFDILGEAVPASSNFFINFISFRGIAMAPFRLFFPHAMVFGSILKWLRLVPRPRTKRDKEAAAPPINCRYSRDLGVLQLTVFVIAFGYAVISPIILPFALLYFVLTWVVWRYQMLYVYQEHYSCGGHYWVYCAHRIVVCLGVMSAFTAAVISVKGGYVAGLILFFTSIAFLLWFDRYLTFRYDAVVDQLPAVGILRAPRATLDERLFVPPPMRRHAVGWTPEWGKAWYGYGVPRYGL